MIEILTITLKLSYLILGLVFLKSVLAKLKKPYQFFLALKDYQFFARGKRLNFLMMPFLISLEFILAISLIVSINSLLILILGMVVQTLYLLLLFINLNKNSVDNCGCFMLNIPKKVSINNVFTNLMILFLFILFYGIENRILGG